MSTVGAWLAAHPDLDRRDREVLLCRAAGLSRAQVLARPERSLDSAAAGVLAGWADRRRSGEPVAYILGSREFWGLDLEVSSAVLVPRPETELLVEVALEALTPSSERSLWERSPDRECLLPVGPNSSSRSGDRSQKAGPVLELGTGSGAVAIALAVAAKSRAVSACITATDVSPPALAVAQRNARRHHADIQWLHGNWFEPVRGRFQLIISNPPYVAEDDPHLADLAHEPRLALAAGPDGLDAIRVIVGGAQRYLEPGGILALEHGYDQAAAVRSLLAAAGFVDVETRADLSGLDRVTRGQWPARGARTKPR